ncbi:MAG: TonB-dependent receptor [Bacteroidota bacterium]
MYRLFALIFLLMPAALQTASAQSPARPDSTLFSYTFENKPVAEALTQVSLDTQVGIGFTSELVADLLTNCAISNAPVEAVLRCILANTNLDIESTATGTYKVVLKPPASDSPSKHTISGFIRDARTGEALLYATVYDRNAEAGVTSNAYGFYSLTLKEGPVSLVSSYVGYEKELFDFDLNQDRTLDISLTPASLGLDTLVVIGEVEASIDERTQMSMVRLPVEQVQDMPALLGEPDVLRAVQLLPGVQSGNEGTTGIYVRGGSVDQNLFLLDGATVYNPSHLFGFLSIFHARALNDVTLLKGGFPARYGGRLSSVIDISMKEGNMKELSGAASLGLAASSLTLEGPIKKDQTSFIFSGRRSLVDVFIAPFTDANDYPAYALFDFNGKLNHRFSSKDRIFASVYGGSDRYEQVNDFDSGENVSPRNQFGISWGNTIATIRWNHLFSDKLFSNTTLLYSRYNLETKQDDVRFRRVENELVQERYRLLYDSGVEDIGGKIDFDFIPSPAHHIRFGTQITNHNFATGTLQLNDGPVDTPRQDTLIVPVSNLNTLEAAIYVEDDIKIGRVLGLNLGLRGSLYAVNGTTYNDIEPRVAARIRVAAGWSLKASYARMSQYIHLLVNSGLGLPTDLWVPATDNVAPQRSEQFTVGLAHSTSHAFEVSLEAYYKTMDNIIEYKEGANFLGASNDWQDNVEAGEGTSYGIELFIQKSTGRTTGWLGYTLSRSDRTFENLNNGETFPFRYDRRHDVALTLVHHLSDRLSLSGSWVYGTGAAVTISTARFSPGVISNITYDSLIEATNIDAERVGPRNGYRMQAYHRLDIGANFTWPTPRGNHVLTLGAYNTYNRRNPYFIFVEENLGESGGGFVDDTEFVLKQASLFPFLPSFSYAFEF